MHTEQGLFTADVIKVVVNVFHSLLQRIDGNGSDSCFLR